MFERLPPKGGGTSGVALGASVLAHLAAGALLLVGPVPDRQPQPRWREITFFAPSRARQAAAPAKDAAPKAGGGELVLPSGPGAMARGAGGPGTASNAPVNKPSKSLSGSKGATKHAGNEASLVVYPFGEGMTRPQRLSGRDPHYTPEALKRGVEGTVIARCTIGSDGQVRTCRIIHGLDLMNEEVVQALESRRYTPVVYDGRPIDADYIFRVNLVLQADTPPAASPPHKRGEGRGGSPFLRAALGRRPTHGA